MALISVSQSHNHQQQSLDSKIITFTISTLYKTEKHLTKLIMYFTTVLVAALSATLAVAAPSKRSCTTSFPVGTTQVHLAKNPAINIVTDLTFNIPAGAIGPCSLVTTFPAGYPISSSGQTQVNVIAKDGPSAGSIVGTTTFTSQPNSPTFVTINSFACRPTMSYTLTLAGTEGAVDFAEGNGAGVAMTYNC